MFLNQRKFFVSKFSKPAVYTISIFLLLCTFISTLIPPFQSPDEFDHIKRAYLLSKGTIVLRSPEGNSSGGMVDTGLSSFMSVYEILKFKFDRKLSADEINSAKNIKWSGIRKFSPAPGTGYYFPAVYVPQAIGLAIGEKLGLSVHDSYYLSRVFALVTVAIILYAASYIYSFNPLLIALLIMPMSIFQFSSASIDGISTALSIFVIASFLRIANDKEDSNPWLYYALIVFLVLIVTCRVNLFPMFLLALVSCLYIKKRKYFFVFVFSFIASLIWLVIAIKTTTGTRMVAGPSTSTVIGFYLKNPFKYFQLLYTTVMNYDLVKFYLKSFLGILGWLDTPFNHETYTHLTIFILLIGFFSFSLRDIRANLKPRILLFLCSLGSVLLIFFALLVTWTPHPATQILGVQGRYFLVPMIMLSYAISGDIKTNIGFYRKLSILILFIFSIYATVVTTNILIDRYYLTKKIPENISSKL